MLDLLELHMWMTHFSDFYKQVGYNYERFDSIGYDNLALKGEKLYRSDPAHWQAALTKGVEFCAEWSRTAHKPLITTECWSVVDYKDFPLLEWGWIKELCEHGVRTACGTQPMVRDGDQQLLRPAFQRHVARRRLAPADDGPDPLDTAADGLTDRHHEGRGRRTSTPRHSI